MKLVPSWLPIMFLCYCIIGVYCVGIICLYKLILSFCLFTYYRFWFVVTMRFIYTHIYMIILSWWSFKFECILTILRFHSSSPYPMFNVFNIIFLTPFCFVYPLTAYYGYIFALSHFLFFMSLHLNWGFFVYSLFGGLLCYPIWHSLFFNWCV